MNLTFYKHGQYCAGQKGSLYCFDNKKVTIFCHVFLYIDFTFHCSELYLQNCIKTEALCCRNQKSKLPMKVLDERYVKALGLRLHCKMIHLHWM